ncbi:LysR family transcriptional regulator [Steroidobacter sp. S1-65]|uniref:LysR family transcriptional regulator n=1 Tax=Steroidobacter gossypii TaxID=2805490 RepID=A0ABS1X4D7_9GAMM|nr:LysR substrate-binding domain-containing protein [Steroidobacter gossypii]MBM0108074.1 LysR family transcriptional regulator [Steroidobacter gossypii]
MVWDHRFPSLVSIRAFEAAARHGSFAKAAHELDTTAASVSYHVRQLEKQVGVTLFHRHPHKVELTGPGELIAKEAMSAFAALRASFINAVNLDQSRLSITALPTFGTSWLTPRLGRFRARHPDIQFELELSAEAQDLTAGRFDAAVRNGHGRWPGLRVNRLFPSIFMPLCAPGLKAAAAKLADPRGAMDVPLLGRTDWWTLWYRSLGFEQVPALDSIKTHLTVEYLDITQAMAGHGVAIGSPILFRNELDAGRLVPAHDLVATDGRAFWFTVPVARQDSRKIVQFRDWISEEAAAARDAAADYIRRARAD